MDETANILIVDDDVNFSETTVDLLNEKGFNCVGVNSGQEAIDKVREMSFDVILLDVRMPVMDGITAYKEIKKIAPQVVIIFVTAYRMDELAKDAVREGEYGVLYKPVDIGRMVKVIERAKKGGALIMVIDDDPNTCETLKDYLEEQGYIVTTAYDGEEALKITNENPQEIVFIDVKLPSLNGLEVYLKMKKINPDVIAVMMTAYRKETKELVDKATKEGVYACLYKPFSIDEMAGILEEIIRKKEGV